MGPVRPSEGNPNGIVYSSPGFPNPGSASGIPSGFTSFLWAPGRGSRQKLTPIARMTRLEHSVARQLGGRKRNFNGEKLWARGYAVSTVGFEEKQIRKYIRHQDHLDGNGDGCLTSRDWPPLGRLTTAKLPALRGRYDFLFLFLLSCAGLDH